MRDKPKAEILALYGKDSKLPYKFKEKTIKITKVEPVEIPVDEMLLNVLCDIVQHSNQITEKLSCIYEFIKENK